jgi:long-chain fatty acid transport protein
MELFRFSLRSAAALLGATMLLPHGLALASGFSLNEMSAASVGNAHAGAAAVAEDASTIYTNPAGLMRMPGRQFMAAISPIRGSSKFENRGSLSAVGTPLAGTGADTTTWTIVPALFYAFDLAPDMRLGLGVHVPFGLKTEYDDGWVGRYQALMSELKTVNLNPALAYRLNDQIFLGAGVSFQYADVELSNAIDFGSACVASLGPAVCAPTGFLPQARDGKVAVKGNDWGFGFNLGAMWTPSRNTRVGVAYRSRIRQELSGDARFSRPAGLPAPLAAARAFNDTSVRGDIDFPESFSIGGYMDLNPKWSVMADLRWMRWNRFRELRLRFDNGAPDNVTRQEWNNATWAAIALNYRLDDMWKLRAGIAYDPTPVKDALRSPRIPDSDRTLLAFGAQYKPSRHGTWDFGYIHLFFRDSSIDMAHPPLGGRLTGRYRMKADIFSAQYSHAF